MKLFDALKIGFSVLAHLEIVHRLGGPIPFELKAKYRGERTVTKGETRLEGVDN